MYRLPIEFAASLKGSSSFVSRIKHNIELSSEYPLITLHSIVGKILRRGERSGYHTDKFAGEDTYKNVKNAVYSVSGATSGTSKTYYQIRAHKNKSYDIRTAQQGSQYLSKYQSNLNNGLDWDDSMQTATWMLKNNPITSLNSFPYQNIILVHPELLGQSRNRNSKEFFDAWCEWIEHYTNWNVYVVDNQGTAYQLNNGKLNYITSSVSTGTLFSF